MVKNQNGKTVNRYTINLDRDTAMILSQAFREVIREEEREINTQKSTVFQIPKKLEKEIIYLTNLVKDFIYYNYKDKDHYLRCLINDVHTKAHENKVDIPLLKSLFNIMFKLKMLDFFIYSLEKEEDKFIKIIRKIAVFGGIIPFEKLSIQDFLYKKFEKIIDDRNGENDNYKNLNNSIFSMLISAISTLGALFALENASDFFKEFLYWFIVIVGLGFIFYFAIFISNLFQIRKNNYAIDAIYTLTEPFDNPEKDINSEYLIFLKTILKTVQEFKKSDDNRVNFKKGNNALKLFMLYKSRKDIKFFFGVLWDIIKEKFALIISVLSYFGVFYIIKDNLINSLTSK